MGVYMMTSFDYSYQNALRRAIVFSIFSFVKNYSCVTQICITNIAAKCILVVVVKLRRHGNVLLFAAALTAGKVKTMKHYIGNKNYSRCLFVVNWQASHGFRGFLVWVCIIICMSHFPSFVVVVVVVVVVVFRSVGFLI